MASAAEHSHCNTNLDSVQLLPEGVNMMKHVKIVDPWEEGDPTPVPDDATVHATKGGDRSSNFISVVYVDDHGLLRTQQSPDDLSALTASASLASDYVRLFGPGEPGETPVSPDITLDVQVRRSWTRAFHTSEESSMKTYRTMEKAHQGMPLQQEKGVAEDDEEMGGRAGQMHGSRSMARRSREGAAFGLVVLALGAFLALSALLGGKASSHVPAAEQGTKLNASAGPATTTTTAGSVKMYSLTGKYVEKIGGGVRSEPYERGTKLITSAEAATIITTVRGVRMYRYSSTGGSAEKIVGGVRSEPYEHGTKLITSTDPATTTTTSP